MFRLGELHLRQSLQDFAFALPRRSRRVALEYLIQLCAYAYGGVQGGHGILEDHGYFLASNLGPERRGHARNGSPQNLRGFGLDLSLRVQQSHGQERAHGFTGAAFPNHRQALARVDGQ